MSLSAILIAAFFVGLSGAMVPGPLLTVAIVQSAQKGWIAGPLLMIGHSLLELLVIAGLFLGLDQLVSGRIFGSVLSLAGGGVLFWMGYVIIKDAMAGKFSLRVDNVSPVIRQRGSGALITLGIVVTAANPYWMLWWVTFGASFLQKSLIHGNAGVLAFFSGHILADFGWYTLVSVMVVMGQKFLDSKVYQYILILSGVFLIFMALYFIYSGIYNMNW
ncbi:LysE family translocator [Metallumcola ferriviriculae]|uniref:LysE family translocator n=1 Tax=Metallumcola ferriviriculae TaxID=3039180 RepID=A0AAU0UQ26_9FIRM|nr:LysE family translocator [Desulfitibacteraceae bacterium MK1]